MPITMFETSAIENELALQALYCLSFLKSRITDIYIGHNL